MSVLPDLEETNAVLLAVQQGVATKNDWQV